MTPGEIIGTMFLVAGGIGACAAFIVFMADADENVRAVRRRLREIESARPFPPRDESLWGDLVKVPRELRPARKMAEGEGPSKGGRAGTGQVAHHDEGSR